MVGWKPGCVPGARTSAKLGWIEVVMPKRYSSSSPSGHCWPRSLCPGHPSTAMCPPALCRRACPTSVFRTHRWRWSPRCCFDCISQPPTSDIDPSNADKPAHMSRRGGSGHLGPGERGKASDSCRRRGRNGDSDVDVRRGKRISGRSVSRRRGRSHQAIGDGDD